MGLTIHYKFTHEGEAAQAVEALWQKALDLPFETVSKVEVFKGPAANFRNCRQRDEWSWLLIQAQRHIDDPAREGYSYSVPASEVVGFSAWPGEGCEDANFGLCLHPAEIFVEGRAISTGPGGWRWSSFCKTQYANDPKLGGVGNFLKCHLAVVALLDEAKKLGFGVEVEDEGEYWEKRDPVALANEVGRWDAMIAAYGGALKDAFGSVVSAMDGRRDFERLEVEGLKDPVVKAVCDLIRRTAKTA